MQISDHQRQALSLIQKACDSKLATQKFPVTKEAIDTESFRYFVNGHYDRIEQSFNPEKLALLEKNIFHGNWQHPIFKTKDLPQLALTLYKENKISHFQFESILEYIQVRNDEHRSEIKFIKILDDNGDFSSDALQLLSQFTPAEKLMAFKEMIKTLPISEQFIYLTAFNHDGYDARDGGLGVAVANFRNGLGSILASDQQIVHFPAGLRHAIGEWEYGKKNYFPPFARLGKQTKEDVENGERKGVRVMSISYPGTVPYDDIHGDKHATRFEATIHDIYHSQVMSSSSSGMRAALFHLIDLIRTQTGITWSKEIWEWVDSGVSMRLRPNYRKFGDFLSKPESKGPWESEDSFYILFKSELQKWDKSLSRTGLVSALSAIAFVDRMKNPALWEEQFQIRGDLSKVHPGLKYVSVDHVTFQKMSFAKQVFFVQYFLAIYENPETKEFLKANTSEYLDRLLESFNKVVQDEDLRFGKFNKPGVEKNRISIAYKGQVVASSDDFGALKAAVDSEIEKMAKIAELKKQLELLNKQLSFA